MSDVLSVAQIMSALSARIEETGFVADRKVAPLVVGTSTDTVVPTASTAKDWEKHNPIQTVATVLRTDQHFRPNSAGVMDVSALDGQDRSPEAIATITASILSSFTAHGGMTLFRSSFREDIRKAIKAGAVVDDFRRAARVHYASQYRELPKSTSRAAGFYPIPGSEVARYLRAVNEEFRMAGAQAPVKSESEIDKATGKRINSARKLLNLPELVGEELRAEILRVRSKD